MHTFRCALANNWRTISLPALPSTVNAPPLRARPRAPRRGCDPEDGCRRHTPGTRPAGFSNRRPRTMTSQIVQIWSACPSSRLPARSGRRLEPVEVPVPGSEPARLLPPDRRRGVRGAVGVCPTRGRVALVSGWRLFEKLRGEEPTAAAATEGDRGTGCRSARHPRGVRARPAEGALVNLADTPAAERRRRRRDRGGRLRRGTVGLVILQSVLALVAARGLAAPARARSR